MDRVRAGAARRALEEHHRRIDRGIIDKDGKLLRTPAPEKRTLDSDPGGW